MTNTIGVAVLKLYDVSLYRIIIHIGVMYNYHVL